MPDDIKKMIEIGDTVHEKSLKFHKGKVMAITGDQTPIYVILSPGRTWHYLFKDDIEKEED